MHEAPAEEKRRVSDEQLQPAVTIRTQMLQVSGVSCWLKTHIWFLFSHLDYLTCTGWLSQRCCLLSAPPPLAHRWRWYQPWPRGWWTSWWVLASSRTWRRYPSRSSLSHMLLLMLGKEKKCFVYHFVLLMVNLYFKTMHQYLGYCLYHTL